MEDIEKFIRDLNWNNPKDITDKAIQELLKVNEEEAVLLANQSNDLCNKSCWHNASIVLKEIGYPRNRLALPYLMNWFQDVNWPGVPVVVELLKDIDIETLVPHIKHAMEKALRDNDSFWAFGILYLLKELNISNSKLKESNLFNQLVELSQNDTFS
ncbi:hypothetical protein CACET_c16050 [Clostridium aceticum]|uniref:Uncharacterized protein n=1 Tax=Clostridium aceticum TaxID=84022 RepID=A0A0D8ICE5_9CLOT|nr:DUF5071 domain-containing protein [Clostridium aceticum]AKL95054.1 hypothetical protein CACET_c16050 [Clostridium aceticum]KJF27943.1 hypothetical protein TZ02_05075 [Clostridium aceticum]